MCNVRAVMRWSGVVGVLVSAVAAVASGADYAPNGLPIIEIWKGQRRMELRRGDAVVRQFQVVLGVAPKYAKESRGDYRTPVGTYWIADKHPSRFDRFLALSYPNVDDAERGYARGMIDVNEWADIFFANLNGEAPTPATALGGRVGIHGFGDRPFLPVDWTEGCIAVPNEDIEYLYNVVPVGTRVVINE
jgi:murein L,D-transpeptidase YafK